MSSAQKRYQRALRQFTLATLLLGYAIGYLWRALTERRTEHDP